MLAVDNFSMLYINILRLKYHDYITARLAIDFIYIYIYLMPGDIKLLVRTKIVKKIHNLIFLPFMSQFCTVFMRVSMLTYTTEYTVKRALYII